MYVCSRDKHKGKEMEMRDLCLVSLCVCDEQEGHAFRGRC